MTAEEEVTASDEGGAADGKPRIEKDGKYYNDWERYNKAEAKAADEEEKAEKEEASQKQMLANMPKGSHLGYEFRKGHKVQFPDITLAEGEGDDVGAWRVACERRETGNESFRDGTIWGAQTGVDAWGQGLLALTRIRNLRKGRVKKATDDVRKKLAAEAAAAAGVQAALEEEGVDYSSAETWEAMGWTGAAKPKEPQDMSKETILVIGTAIAALKEAQSGPTDAEVENLVCTLQMNVAQGLLKLGQCEAAVGHCDTAIAMDPTNVKALWRKAKAVWGTRNPGLAREALDALLKVDPSNPAAVSMLREIEVEEARRRKKRTGVNIKPAFRFPNTSKPSETNPQLEGGGEEEEHEQGDEDAGKEDEDEYEETSEQQQGTAGTAPAKVHAASLEQNCSSAAEPVGSGWSCCRRKRKSA